MIAPPFPMRPPVFDAGHRIQKRVSPDESLNGARKGLLMLDCGVAGVPAIDRCNATAEDSSTTLRRLHDLRR
ncbi:hypothetical protein E3N88_35478 [Mikania micrantha]|uniref:Uncharacterized protein n=1 Tax=Mikania micrantha TaxID=192012 RepID=A0A5N6M170_9ASTR|nr:hypothetical protein E3N88_35478 [Mikania micrantha]